MIIQFFSVVGRQLLKTGGVNIVATNSTSTDDGSKIQPGVLHMSSVPGWEFWCSTQLLHRARVLLMSKVAEASVLPVGG
jgi:hypothetical protein